MRFKLRHFSINRPSLIYGVFSVEGKLYKISISVKIYSNHWDKKRNRAIISPCYDNLTNQNNLIANQRLNLIEESFNSKIAYLCNHIGELKNLVASLSSSINQHYKKRTNMAKRQKSTSSDLSVISLIRQHIRKNHEDRTAKNYVQLTNYFESFLKKKKIKDVWESMTFDTLEKYRDYLKELETVQDDGKQKTLNMLVKWLFEIEDKNVFKLDREIKELHIKAKKTRKYYVILTFDEIRRIADISDEEIDEHLKYEKRDEAKRHRDYFVIQSLTGVRISDLYQLFQKENIRQNNKGIDYFSFIPQKTEDSTGTESNIRFDTYKDYDIVHGLIERIYEKHKDIFNQPLTETEENHYRVNIRELCKIAKINREVRVKKNKKNGNQSFDKIYNVIKTHSARHTFVTNCFRYLHYDESQIIKMTGHANEKMVREIYLNLDTNDIVENLGNPKNKKEKAFTPSLPLTSNIYDTLPSSKEEFRAVLKMLGNAIGINPLEYEGISDIRSMCQLLFQYEGQIIRLCEDKIDLERIKEIFNDNANEEKRNSHLKNLIEYFNKNKL